MLHQQKRKIASNKIAEKASLVLVEFNSFIKIESMSNTTSSWRRKVPVHGCYPLEYAIKCSTWALSSKIVDYLVEVFTLYGSRSGFNPTKGGRHCFEKPKNFLY